MRIDTTMTYTNGAGETIEFAPASPWGYTGTDLRDWEWDYDEACGRAVGFRRAARTFTLDVAMRGGSAAERDRACDVFEHDLRAGVPGTLRAGASEMRCYVVASEKDLWWFDGSIMRASLRVRADEPVWVRERTVDFPKDSGSARGAGYLDYPIAYPYDYKREDRASRASNPFPGDCRFRLTVFGPAENPYVIVGGNRYQVNASVPDGALLTVDSREGTISLRSEDGSESSVFASGVRAEGARIFAPMPGGESSLSWSGDFGFSITYIEERSEPAWT